MKKQKDFWRIAMLFLAKNLADRKDKNKIKKTFSLKNE